MDVKGTIIEISQTQQISDKFQKREFVIEYADNPQYPEFVKFETIQDKVNMLDEYKLGDEVVVYFNLKGRKWTDPQGQVKYFNSLQAWRMQKAEASGAQSAPTDNNLDDLPFEDAGGDEEDLPF
ncbi:MAG: DUF3127 domain-containing protein [Cyclobacteriaceae bacterium]